MTNVNVLVGAGSIGQAIARRVSAGKHLVLADLRQENADAAAKTLSDAGFNVSTAAVEVSSRASIEALVQKAVGIGEITGLIHVQNETVPEAPSSGAQGLAGGTQESQLDAGRYGMLRGLFGSIGLMTAHSQSLSS